MLPATAAGLLARSLHTLSLSFSRRHSRRSVSKHSRSYTLPRVTGAQWQAAWPELEPILLREVDAVVQGANKPQKNCDAYCEAILCCGTRRIDLKSVHADLINKGWLAKVDAVLGRHGMVADLELFTQTTTQHGEVSRVSHAEASSD